MSPKKAPGVTNSTGGNTNTREIRFGVCKPTRVSRHRHNRRRNRDREFFARYPDATEYTRALTAAERAFLTAALGVGVLGTLTVSRDGRRVFSGSFSLGGGRE
ncbi:hypothetical protein IRT45_15940 [Nocardia sp. BSTN01]|uniref:hypothetical protein n=1 Tax=Nocardia sp. BSTN01 TaxID=2783665 RepID=UPI00188F1056|nr:hypothetical protein [Nocardia sp. BSTN01]MBF4998642.1 hypothetical protein [Nocardia sp. BSTN01]